ncbi:hypothetical protein, partial [Mycobacterium asiaticum]|uniref:hypothetical protein n=1 Tax=Mycobacterium asiaticum TaxID=1790 RepID=UPI001C12B4D8
MVDQTLHALHRRGGAGLEFERIADEPRDSIGDHDAARGGQAAHPGRKIGAESIHVGLEINRAVAKLSAQVRARFGFEVRARVGVHRGVVYLDTTQADVYGLGANLAARVCSLAPPGGAV